jgi:pimeloyl-ACP methyl ester carboxylesterase
MSPVGLIHPVLPSARGAVRTTWLVLPGWGQSGAHWVPLARWLSSAGIRLWWADVRVIADHAQGRRGGVERLVDVAAGVDAERAGLPISAVVAHSASAPVATLLSEADRTLRLALLDPVPAQFGLSRGEPAPDGVRRPGPARRPLGELYPFAAAEVLRQISTAGGSDEGDALTAGAFPAGSHHPGRVSRVADALRRLATPLVLVRGAASTVCSDDLARRFCAQAPAGGRVHTVDRAGHSPHIDRPQSVAEILTSVLNGSR